ncbi:hypothetical protein Tco_1320314 [Tanacetum coccineum]
MAQQVLALGWNLEEIHVTWAHLEKKQTRLQTCTKIHQEVLFSKRGDDVIGIKLRRRNLSGDGVWILVTTSQRDHSRPSHEGYRNTIELPKGAKVSPLRPDTIRLVQNGCAFHELMSKDSIQHLKDFLKIVDFIDLNGATRNTTHLRPLCFSIYDQAINWLDHCSRDPSRPGMISPLVSSHSFSHKDILMFQQRQDKSLYDAWTRFKYLLQKVPHHGLDLWLQVQIFYNHVDYTTQMAIDYAAGERLRKLRSEEAWETIEDLGQHEEKEWNDLIFSEKESLDYIDATLEQELESVEYQVVSLMRNEVLLEYEVGFMFPKRPYQEELEARILNLINHQEDQVRQLEEDMRKTKDTFMCLADTLIATLKVEIKSQRVHSTKIEKITRFPTHTLTVTPETFKPITHQTKGFG